MLHANTPPLSVQKHMQHIGKNSSDNTVPITMGSITLLQQASIQDPLINGIAYRDQKSSEWKKSRERFNEQLCTQLCFVITFMVVIKVLEASVVIPEWPINDKQISFLT